MFSQFLTKAIQSIENRYFLTKLIQSVDTSYKLTMEIHPVCTPIVLSYVFFCLLIKKIKLKNKNALLVVS